MYPFDARDGVAGMSGVAVAASDAVVDAARADHYGALAACLGAAPSAGLLAALADLRADETPLGRAYAALAAAAAATDAETAGRDFFDLFVGVGRGELLPYGSYYLTGFLNERPLAAVRADLAALGLARAEGLHDPEDHIAFLCGVMATLARGGWAGSPAAPSQATLFRRHLAPWAPRFFDELARARPAGFYPAVGRVGAAFMAVEAEAFTLAD